MNTQIVNIGDVSLEVLPQMMRRIETLRVGSKVKVLRKDAYSSEHSVYPGVVIGFEPFKSLPTVIIAYAKIGYGSFDLQFLHYNAQSKDVEVVAAVASDIDIDRDAAEGWFDREIEKKRREITDIQGKREFFRQKLGAAWASVPADAAAE